MRAAPTSAAPTVYHKGTSGFWEVRSGPWPDVLGILHALDEATGTRRVHRSQRAERELAELLQVAGFFVLIQELPTRPGSLVNYVLQRDRTEVIRLLQLINALGSKRARSVIQAWRQTHPLICSQPPA